MIVVPILIIAIIFLVRFQKGTFAAFLVLVATKSIMDAFWNYQLGPFSMLAVQGFVIPFLFYDVFKKGIRMPVFWKRTAKIYLIAMMFGLFWGFFIKPVGAFQTAFVSFNSFIGFFLIPIFITDIKRLKHFLLALMASGIFPIAVSIFQLQTGVVFQERQTVGLIRYVGFYHDAFPVRFYGFITLFSILIYQNVFLIRTLKLKIFLIALAGGTFVSIYAVFSKAAISIIALWVVLLLIFSKSKTKPLISISIGLVVIFLAFGDAVASNITQLFSKEIGYNTGEVNDARYTLAGRGYIWQDYWKFWVEDQNTFFQWFGDGLTRPVHNEFFRVLLTNGIVGVFFLLLFIFASFKNLIKMNSNVRVFGLMLFGMYIIDCLGLVPGLYYYYNILVWGIFGLLLMRPQLFINHNKV